MAILVKFPSSNSVTVETRCESFLWVRCTHPMLLASCLLSNQLIYQMKQIAEQFLILNNHFFTFRCHILFSSVYQFRSFKLKENMVGLKIIPILKNKSRYRMLSVCETEKIFKHKNNSRTNTYSYVSFKDPYFDELILYSCQKALQRKCACKQIIHDQKA